MPRRLLIACIVFIDALGYGLLLPILPAILRRFESDPCVVSRLFGYFATVYAVVQFLAAPGLGALSDRYGRRPLLLLSLAGAAVDYLLMAYAPTLGLLFVGRVVSGLAGASIAVANAYAADISDGKSRAGNFGMLAAALGSGIIVGPGVGGLLAVLGFRVPFLTAVALNLISFVAALVVLPESLAEGSRRRLDPSRCNPFSTLWHVFGNSRLASIYWSYLLFYLAGRATSSMWALFTEQRFAWSPAEIGASLGFMGLVMASAQSALPRMVTVYLGETRTLRAGLLVSAVTNVAIGLATRGWMLYVTIAVSAFCAIVGPILQSSISRATPADAQGELQGRLAAIGSLTAIAGPLLYTNVFTFGMRRPTSILFTGAPFLVASAFCAAAWLLGPRPAERHTSAP